MKRLFEELPTYLLIAVILVTACFVIWRVVDGLGSG